MGPTVILTASAGTFPGLLEALRAIPIAVEEHPLLSFKPPVDWAPLDAALDRVSSYTAIAFTSPRGAQSFVERLDLHGRSWSGETIGPAIWAVGPATGRALAGKLGPVQLPPIRRSGRSAAVVLAEAMLEAVVKGPVLFPCGETRREELAAELRLAGVEVDEVVCYRSVLADESEARAAAARGNLLVVASPTVIDLLARACPRPNRPELLAVGPTTAASARAAGWSPAAVATAPSAGALTSAIRDLIDKR